MGKMNEEHLQNEYNRKIVEINDLIQQNCMDDTFIDYVYDFLIEWTIFGEE